MRIGKSSRYSFFSPPHDEPPKLIRCLSSLDVAVLVPHRPVRIYTPHDLFGCCNRVSDRCLVSRTRFEIQSCKVTRGDFTLRQTLQALRSHLSRTLRGCE